MSAPFSLKKPKVEERENDGEVAAMANQENGVEEEDEDSVVEQEEAMVALIEHRTKEVQHLRKKVTYYQSQLDEAEKRVEDLHSKLARLRSRNKVASSKNSPGDDIKVVKDDSPVRISEDSRQDQPQSRPQLVIPAVNPKISQPVIMVGSSTKESSEASGSQFQSRKPRMSVHNNIVSKLKGNESHSTSTEPEASEVQAKKGTKRKFEQKEHKELISLICSRSYANTIHCQTGCLMSSRHKRKLRSLVLCPANDELFMTSSSIVLDNSVLRALIFHGGRNDIYISSKQLLWMELSTCGKFRPGEVTSSGIFYDADRSSASLLSSTEALSPKQRRWPEDIAWHPEGNSVFAVYSADGGDSQISVLNLNKRKEGARVCFLEQKPHLKGIINNIVFMPWDQVCFVTGGSDHAVVLWTDKEDGENSWKPKVLHRNLHSSAVMGVAGMQQKHIVLSAGADRRIFGFDMMAERTEYRHQIESKCMSILPNPCDFNLFMVQTGTPERQLRLFDIRLRQTVIHEFGWKQESSESQSALINQAWSPDGLYITSGSADPVIHIFDIRYNAHNPSQSVKAHQKRVFKALWHHSLPLLISISSDLNIGLHKIM
ncbi:hypothetical protein RHGRI_024673 [Rhododendron griersonianum]|uniref:Nucleotide binding protein n=1 Tax=Rhododendron griersonianum TaxID=479676 RepID=A0AAV6JBS9_9ERIC|nr:hypothetical protein RHGRI_024673 [Rhododendron griersonianum]